MASSGAPLSPQLSSLAALLSLERSVCEVGVSLREGLEEVGSEFCHARTRGLLSLCSAVSRAAEGEQGSAALRALLGGRLEVDVLSLLLGGSLAPPHAAQAVPSAAAPLAPFVASSSPWGGPPQQPAGGSLAAPPTHDALRAPDEQEALAAALLLRGVCLLDPATREAAGSLGAVETLLQRAHAAQPGSQLRAATLDALAALLADSNANQAEFTGIRGAQPPPLHHLSLCFTAVAPSSRLARQLCAGASLAAAMLRAPGATSDDPVASAFLVALLCRGVLDEGAARAAEAAMGVELAARIIRGSTEQRG